MNTLFASLLVLCACCAMGCSSTKPTLSAVYPQPLSNYNLELKRTTAGDVNFTIRIVGIGADTCSSINFVRNIREIRTALIHPEQGFVDSLSYTLASAYATSDTANRMELEGLARWTNTLGMKFDSLYTQTFITARDGRVYAFEYGAMLPPTDDRQESMQSMELKGWMEDTTASPALFVVLAERKRMVSSEYFPTSERLRVVIADEDGKVVWNSAQVQVFMQMIAPIEPKNTGEVRRYETPWNGEDMTGQPVPPGKYTATLTLATRPYPYSVVVPFRWKLPNDQ